MTALPRAAGGTGRQSVALAVISAAQLMFLLDATIVNVALPAIQRAVGLTGSDLEWVVASYSVAFGGLLLLGGRAGDLLGRRRVFTSGVALFTVASLVGGCAGDGGSWLLIVCRALQGVGAAAASPAALSLIAVTFEEGPRRDRAVGWYTAVVTAGGGLGLLAGGLITTYLSWRWVMFVNVPVGVLVLAAVRRVLPETPRRTGDFDAAGALTGTLAALLLVYGLVAGAERGGDWGSPAVAGSLAGAAVLAPVFVLLERRAAQPLVPLRLFKDRTRFGTYTVTALESTAMFGIFFFLTLFLQRFWDYGPLRTALVYLPLTCVLVAGAKLSSGLVARIGARRLVCGGLLAAAAGMVWLSRIGGSGGWATGMLPPTVLVYAGLGVTGVPLTLAALARVADEDSGAASGLFTMSRQIGGAVGLAVLGAVVWPSAAGAASGGGDAGAGAGGGRVDADAALAAGIADGFLVAAGLTVLAALVALVTVPRTAGARVPAERADGTASAESPGSPVSPGSPKSSGPSGTSDATGPSGASAPADAAHPVNPAGPTNASPPGSSVPSRSPGEDPAR